MTKHKTYIGDGAFVELDYGNMVVLTTNDGVRDTNRICLEPEVLHSLIAWLEERGLKTS